MARQINGATAREDLLSLLVYLSRPLNSAEQATDGSAPFRIWYPFAENWSIISFPRFRESEEPPATITAPSRVAPHRQISPITITTFARDRCRAFARRPAGRSVVRFETESSCICPVLRRSHAATIGKGEFTVPRKGKLSTRWPPAT